MFRNRVLVIFIFIITQGSFVYAINETDKISLSVSHSGNDIVGTRLAFSLREEIRASVGYELQSERPLVTVLLATLDPNSGDSSREGWSTVAAIVVTMRNDVPYKKGDPQTWYPIYLSSVVQICGSKRVEEIAKLILADVDKTIEDFREAARRDN